MSEREQTIRRAYAGLGEGELDAVMAFCHDDVVWDWSRSLAPFAGVYHGREGLQTLLTFDGDLVRRHTLFQEREAALAAIRSRSLSPSRE